jgi:hypothetical protein
MGRLFGKSGSASLREEQRAGESNADLPTGKRDREFHFCHPICVASFLERKYVL